MSSYIIASLIFWGTLICLGLFVYQVIILPSIRLYLRYRVFELRDQVRRLVIERKVEQNDRAFHLLHGRLNFMCTSLSRFDLARVVRASKSLNEENRARVANYVRIMKSAPAEIQEIYRESLNVVMLALTFNSFLFFVGASICLLVAVALKSIFDAVKQASLVSVKGVFRMARDLFQKQVDADSTVAFFSPELATV